MAINWYPGHMAKAKRDFYELSKISDFIIEIVDARIPIASSNPDVEELIRKQKKIHIKILSKSDLSNKRETEQWIQYFGQQGIYAFSANLTSQKHAERLTEKIMDYVKKQKVKRPGMKYRGMVVGVPNVGKSTFINLLKGKNSLKVENRPGVTKSNAWFPVFDNLELLDSPGVLWPKFSEERGLKLALCQMIKDTLVEKDDLAVYLVRNAVVQGKVKGLNERYNLSLERCAQEDIYDIDFEVVYEAVARRIGALRKGNRIDYERVSNQIIQDFRENRISFTTLEHPGLFEILDEELLVT